MNSEPPEVCEECWSPKVQTVVGWMCPRLLGEPKPACPPEPYDAWNEDGMRVGRRWSARFVEDVDDV